MLSLGQETLAPYSRADSEGRPMFRLPGSAAARLPFLSYAAGAYMARLVEQIVKQAPQRRLNGLRDRHGREPEGDGARCDMAFLPASSVGPARRLVAPAGAGLGR
jgi:hypothetical protein